MSRSYGRRKYVQETLKLQKFRSEVIVIVNGDRLKGDNIKLYLTAANAVVIDAHIPSTAIPFGCPIFDGNSIGSVKDTQTTAMT